MKKIRIAIVGLGNCASSLLQGIEFYKKLSAQESIGLTHYNLGGYTPGDIEVVAAFDVDKRKVGYDISEAIFAKPNCTQIIFKDYPYKNVKVSMGKVLDGVANHMQNYPDDQTFVLSEHLESEQKDVVRVLKESQADILLNYLPVGSVEATYFYMECALEAGVGVVNNIPVFIASDPIWERRFREHRLPIVGDDIKSQLGATIVHRTLANLFESRGVKITNTYQLNTGGNTDFLNMLDMHRLALKKKSKTEAVQSILDKRLDVHHVHIGPSDYVTWQKDNKICFLRIEGEIFGQIPINLELRLSVEDSPNSAGVAIDMIRCCQIALDRGESGAVMAASAYFCKHPLEQMSDFKARKELKKYIDEDQF
jgi:myo-inositol-1-phosphate synthase